MRSYMLAAMAAGLLATASPLIARDGCAVKAPTCQAAPSCGCNAGDLGCDNRGDPCCGRGNGCGRLGHKCGCPIDGLDRYANCGCNGSYNYPVPPLYTYHWPGMYKQVRMTDYHSPWRFPPLKRYEDEPLPTVEIPAPRSAAGPRLLRPASLQVAPADSAASQRSYHSEIEPLSSRLSR
ncbi:MAG: hypothetical protein IAF94_17020 [Pirellulaceae bacterium]|nr:hypothetical protein [Pirellulaceae bacterium]